MQHELTTHAVYFARTGERQEIGASSWRDALRLTGRPDACIIERLADREFEATFDPDAPTIIEFRARYATEAEMLRWILASVANQVAHISEQEVSS